MLTAFLSMFLGLSIAQVFSIDYQGRIRLSTSLKKRLVDCVSQSIRFQESSRLMMSLLALSRAEELSVAR